MKAGAEKYGLPPKMMGQSRVKTQVMKPNASRVPQAPVDEATDVEPALR